MSQIFVGAAQGITKDCVVGDRLMNRYAIFNGLNAPRRINANMEMELLGIPQGTAPYYLIQYSGGGMTPGKWYAYKIVWASTQYRRPVPVNDGSIDLMELLLMTSQRLFLKRVGYQNFIITK